MAQSELPLGAGSGAVEDLLPNITPPSSFGAGLRGGTGGGIASVGGLLRMLGDSYHLKPAAALGESLNKYGSQVMEENPSPVSDLSQIDSLSKLGSFAAYALGNAVPSMGMALVGGALGKRIAGEAGATTGVIGTSIGQETGGIYNEAKDAGVIDPSSQAIMYGAAAGALDAVPELALGRALRIFKGSPLLDKLFAEASGTSFGAKLAATAKSAANVALMEGATERAQTYLEQKAVGREDAPGAESERDIATAMGVIGGGAAGAVAGAVRRPTPQVPPELPPTTPVAPQLPPTPPDTPINTGALDVPMPPQDLAGMDYTPPDTLVARPEKSGLEPLRSTVLPDTPVYAPKGSLTTGTVLGEPAAPQPLIVDEVTRAMETPAFLRTIDQIATLNLNAARISLPSSPGVPDVGIIEIQSGNVRSRMAYDEAEKVAAAAELEREQNAIDQISRQGSGILQYQDGNVGGQATEAGGGNRPEYGASSLILPETPGLRSGKEKAAVTAVAQLKQQAGILLDSEEVRLIRAANEPANVPDLVLAPVTGGVPRETMKTGSKAEKTDYLLTKAQEAVTAEVQPLVDAGVLKPNVATSVRSVIVKALQDVIASNDLSTSEVTIKNAIAKALNRKMPKQDVETFVDAAYQRLNEIPKVFLSKAASDNGVVQAQHWGNVPTGYTDPTKIGTGVQGRDQAAAKLLGLNYTSAVVQGSDYREPAVQAGKEHRIALNRDRIYDASNWRTDPLFAEAKVKVKDQYGPDEGIALVQYQKDIQALGYDAAQFANGQLRIFTPQRAVAVEAINKWKAQAPQFSNLHAVHGGVSYDLNNNQNRAGVEGFAVSTFKGLERKVEGAEVAPAQIAQFVEENYSSLAQPRAMLGLWFNDKDGHSYLDVSTVIDTKEEALALAAANNQLAIYDLKNFQEIPVVDTSIAQMPEQRAKAEGAYDRISKDLGLQVEEFLGKMLGAPKNLVVGGYYSTPGQEVGRYKQFPSKSVIEFAYNSKDVLSTLAHEGFHYLEHEVLNSKERAVIADAFSVGGELRTRLLARVRMYDIKNGTSLEDEVRAVPAETRAYGYEFWRKGELEVKGPLAKIFEKIKAVVDRLRNFVAGRGFQTYQDIFQAIERGNYARDEAAGIRVNSAIDTDWYLNVEPDVLPGAVSVFNREAEMKAGPSKRAASTVASAARGRPWWIKSAGDVATLRRVIRRLALEGEDMGGRTWHIRSSTALNIWSGGDKKKAALLATLISAYSPRTQVGRDLKNALLTYAKYMAGKPITDIPAISANVAKAIEVLKEDPNVLSGIKRQNFFRNMMQIVDPENYGPNGPFAQGATVDMWISHAFGFAINLEGGLGDGQYDYANWELQKLANELGWGVEEVQAAVWVSIKSRANSVRRKMQLYAREQGWVDITPNIDKETGKQKVHKTTGEPLWTHTVKKEHEREYVMTWMNMANQAPRPAQKFIDTANYSYGEAFQDLANGTISIDMDEAEAAIAEDWFTGFKGQDVSPVRDPAMVVLFSKAAATVEMIQRARNGQDETEQLRRAIAGTIDRAGLDDGFRQTLFGLGKATGSSVVDSLRNFYEGQIASGQYLARASLGYKNTFGVLTAYSQRRNRLISQALEKDLHTWVNTATTVDREAVSKVLLDRTVNNWKEGDARLADALGTLTESQRLMYTQARKMIDTRLVAEFRADQSSYAKIFGIDPAIYAQWQAIAAQSSPQAANDQLFPRTQKEAEKNPNPQQNAYELYDEWFQNRRSQVDSLIQNGYFPERRYGDHGVHVSLQMEGKPLTLFFELHESRAAADQRRAQIMASLKDYPELKVEYGYKYKAEYDGSLSYQQFLDMAARQGIALTQSEKERLARALISSDSARNNRIFRRENVPGMSKDGMRILAEFAVGSSNKIAYSELGSALQDARKGAAVDVKFDELGRPVIATDTTANTWKQDGEMGGFYHTLADRTVDFATGPSQQNAFTRNLRAAAGLNFLGGSLSTALVNMTSLGMNTIPFLTKDTSYTNATGKVLAGVRIAASIRNTMLDLDKMADPNVKLDGVDEVAGLRQALTIAAQDGTVLDTELYQLMGLTRGQQYSWSKGVQTAAEKWMLPFRYTEQINRIATFIAAYKIGQEKQMGGDQLYRYAQDAVYSTHFRYDEANRPAMARGPLGSVLFTFKTYPLFAFELIQHLAKENPSAAAIMLLSFALAAGIEGLPFAEDMMDLVDTISQRVFGSPFNTERAMKNFLKSSSEAIVGADLSEVMLHGVANTLTGMNFASRVGMGNFIPASRLGTADSDFKQNAMEVLGPAGGYIPNLLIGADMATRGQWDGAMRKILPGAASNLVKGWQQWQKGYATDAGGRKLIDVGGPWAFAQSLGFSSAALNQAYMIDRMDKQTNAFYVQTKADFMKDIVKAATDGNVAGIQEAVDAVTAWNSTYPDFPIAITATEVRTKVAQAKMPMDMRRYLSLPKQTRGQSESALGLMGN